MTLQQGDVLLHQSPNDGEINVDDGVIEMVGGLETAAYLSLFGGDERDDGSQDNEFNWWGNSIETESINEYRSETGNLLRSIVINSASIVRIRDAVLRDLEWFKTSKVANIIEVIITLPALNTVSINIKIEAFGQESEFTFVENWKASQ